MGWRAIAKDGTITSEEKDGRPVQAGEEGQLACIEQNDFGHRVGIDLLNGVILIDYEEDINIQNGTFEVKNPKTVIFACDDTNIIAEYRHYEAKYELRRDEKGRKMRDENGKLVQMRHDILTPLIFRPIWFTRYTNGVPTKVIGVQTTTPDLQGARNVKFMVMIFADGRLGISAER